MELYFLRHGLAVDAGSFGKDEARPLVAEGIEKTESLSRALVNSAIAFDVIASSPYLRARQTAEIVARFTEFKGSILYTEHLTPHAEYNDFVPFLKQFKPDQKILLTGHQPSLGIFISQLLCGEDDLLIDLKKGSLCRVDVSVTDGALSRGGLKWLWTAKQLKNLK